MSDAVMLIAVWDNKIWTYENWLYYITKEKIAFRIGLSQIILRLGVAAWELIIVGFETNPPLIKVVIKSRIYFRTKRHFAYRKLKQ